MTKSVNNAFELNQPLSSNLIQIIGKNNFSNAYIFYGPDGTGKKEAAFNFISEIMRGTESTKKIIEQIKENNHPDFMSIEPTYLVKGHIINQSDITLEAKPRAQPLVRVDQIRQIRRFLSIKAIQSDKKFILIIDSHRLNESSSNCLLKTLEEPANGIFILLTSNINLLLDTIISRCQKIKFKPYSHDQLVHFLEKQTNVLELIDNKNLNIKDLIFISNGSPKKLLENIQIWNQIPQSLIKELENHKFKIEQILFLAKFISEELDLSSQEILLDYIQRSWWRKTQNMLIVKELEEIKKNLKNNVHPKISWEVGLLKININQ